MLFSDAAIQRQYWATMARLEIKAHWDIGVSLLIAVIALGLVIKQGGFIGYPLLIAIALGSLCHLRRGASLKQLGKNMLANVQRAAPVMVILLLIGGVTATWMAAGTVPALVYYGLGLVNPKLFILSAFLLTSAISVLIGTSFGAAGTVGVALMVMARSGEINLHWVAGAIIAGAYVGDRCSPLSSSAHFVAALTRSNIYQNLRLMVQTSGLPLLLSCCIYLVLSLMQPLTVRDRSLITAIPQAFHLHGLTLAPAIVVVVLASLRANVKLILALSLLIAGGLATGLQGMDAIALGKTVLTGYGMASESPLSEIFRGGGIAGMMRVCLIVILSTALASLVVPALSQFRSPLQPPTQGQPTSYLFRRTAGIGLFAAVVGCTQTLAILLTQQLTQPAYDAAAATASRHALDIEDTAVVMSPLVPWNIAGFVPAAILSSDAGFIPYAVYLYLLPLVSLIVSRPMNSAKSGVPALPDAKSVL